jgi:NAD(P)-dependent dehydrogenase (short-subunit alcohol dehydrogenase family)
MAKYKLEGKAVIITGASAGLGEQFAHGFAESGANVVLAARRMKLLEKIAKDVSDTLDDWHTVMDVNLTSAFLATREAAKVMIPKKSGSIVNISSTFGFGGTVFTEVSYYVSKGGLVTMTKALAVELGQYNIRVNAIAPKYITGHTLAVDGGWLAY